MSNIDKSTECEYGGCAGARMCMDVEMIIKGLSLELFVVYINSICSLMVALHQASDLENKQGLRHLSVKTTL